MDIPERKLFVDMGLVSRPIKMFSTRLVQCSKGVAGVADGFSAHPRKYHVMRLKEQGLKIPTPPGWSFGVALPPRSSGPLPSGGPP